METKKLLVAVLFASAVLGQVQAKDLDVKYNDRELVTSFGYGELQFGAAWNSNIGCGCDGTTFAGRIDGGYYLTHYVALEGGFTGLSNFGVSQNPSYPDVPSGNASVNFVDVSAKFMLPLGEVFQLDLQGGIAYAMASSTLSAQYLKGDYNDFKGFVAIGGQFNLSRRLSIVINDYAYLGADNGFSSGGFGNTNMLMGGMKVNF